MNKNHASNFTEEELQYYSRQITMPEFGLAGQERLKNSKIVVIGAGGLGAPVLQYLAAAGVGTIGIFDFDYIEKSNLHRQVLFNHSDVGKLKADTATERLRKLNPYIEIIPHNKKITPDNAVELLKPYDQVVDGSDNFLTRYIINSACLSLDIPLVYGSIYRFEGQVTVFNYVDENGNRGPELHDLYPQIPDEAFIPNCSEAGVLGALPGTVGSIQAAESIKIATGLGKVLSGKLLVMDLLNSDTQTITFYEPNTDRTIDQKTIQERFRNLTDLYDNTQDSFELSGDSQISADSLARALRNDKNIDLIDVRSEEEHQSFNLGGRLIPLDELEIHSENISKEKTTVFYCQTGKRSAEAVRTLQKQKVKGEYLSLKGGVAAWLELQSKPE